jgi:trans-aconitate methyltransferase
VKKIIPAITRRLRRVSDYIAHPFSEWERLYRKENPWSFERESEIHRFEETNRIIREMIGPVETILEFGSAEGHQTERLLRVADKVQGIDISATAVKRARRKFAGNPKASFTVANAQDIKIEKPVDLMTAFEILYYIAPKNVPRVLDMMDDLSRKRIVSTYWPHVQVLEDFLFPTRNTSRQIIYWENEPRWLVAWW